MAWLQQTWRKQTIWLGLLIHFCLWWTFFTWVWTRGDRGIGWLWSAIESAVAPLHLGIWYWQHDSDRFWAAQGIVSFFALAGFTAFALGTQKRWITLLAHAAVVAYWFYSALLIAAGE
jgi:hypothetical protein